MTNPAITPTHDRDSAIKATLAEIDRQHSGLLEQVDRLERWRDHGHATSVVFDMLTMLNSYVQEHFRYEEKFLAAYGYPGLEKHIGEHCALSEKVTAMFDHLVSGDDVDTELVALLRDWITTHIGVEDQEFIDYFAANP